MEIREFDAVRDQEAVRACCIELQDFERSLDPRIPRGEDIADRYLELMFRRCREFDGLVLVAEVDGAVVGYVSIWIRYRSDEPNDDPTEHGYICDLVVSADQRGRGIGRALLGAAEARVRAAGMKALRISVLAASAGARALYVAQGFEEEEISLEKRLD